MTIICWRNGFMASDSCWATYGTQTVSAVKIQRLSSGALLGSAGDNDARAMVKLLDGVKSPRGLPSRRELADTKTDYEGLIAFPKGGVWMIVTGRHDETGYPLGPDGAEESESDYGVWPATTMGGFAAAGCGADYALAAMKAHASVSAYAAVKVACELNVHCKLPVHVVPLHPKRRKKR